MPLQQAPTEGRKPKSREEIDRFRAVAERLPKLQGLQRTLLLLVGHLEALGKKSEAEIGFDFEIPGAASELEDCLVAVTQWVDEMEDEGWDLE